MSRQTRVIVNMLMRIQGKDKAADIIKEKLPEVAQKTTFLWYAFPAHTFTLVFETIKRRSTASLANRCYADYQTSL
jgi:uncharacterized membrane protein